MSVSEKKEMLFPIRQDIKVLPADDSKKLILDWIYFEGEVVFREKDSFKEDANYEEIDIRGKKVKLYKDRLKSFGDIKEGDVVYSTGYYDEVLAMKVESIDATKHTALGKLNDYCYGNLYFNDDARECWRCGGYMFINKEAIAKVSISK